MTDQSENLIPEYLRGMRGDMAGIKGKLEALFTRIVSVQGHLARIDTLLAHLGGDILHQNARSMRWRAGSTASSGASNCRPDQNIHTSPAVIAT